MKRLSNFRKNLSSSKSYVLTNYTNRPVTLGVFIVYYDHEWSSPPLAEHRRLSKGMEGGLLKPDGEPIVGIVTRSGLGRRGLSSPLGSIDCF